MNSEYVTLLTVMVALVSSLSTAFITGYLSRKASTDVIDKEHKIEKKKEKEQERRELITLYISVIKANYESSIVTYHPNGLMEMNEALYKGAVRRLIYGKYHLIHDTVIKHFNNIEEKNQKISDYEMYSDNSEIQLDIYSAADSYVQMVKEIRRIVDKERLNK